MADARSIVPVEAGDLDAFFTYLNDHIADNGSSGVGYFLPIPRGQARLPEEKVRSFRGGLAIAVGEPGWRRAFVCRTAGRIAGHVDLHGYPERFVEHRCVLGLGVDRDHRRGGVGAELLQHALAWAARVPTLEWVDLQVLAENLAARRLYARHGFVDVGTMSDRFRFDGRQFADVTMTKRLRA